MDKQADSEGFNRINSGRSIPTCCKILIGRLFIDPGFNRINSGRSIPTLPPLRKSLRLLLRFQSYQFRQINPDNEIFEHYYVTKCEVSIVSIQADQSRRVYILVVFCFLVEFQSYQFRQINPDIVPAINQGQFWIVSIVSIQADQSRQCEGRSRRKR